MLVGAFCIGISNQASETGVRCRTCMIWSPGSMIATGSRMMPGATNGRTPESWDSGVPLGRARLRVVVAGLLKTQIDVIRAHPEGLPELAHLWHLWRPATAFPQVDRLRVHPDLQRQLVLRPAPLLAKRPDRLHHSLSPLYTIDYSCSIALIL